MNNESQRIDAFVNSVKREKSADNEMNTYRQRSCSFASLAVQEFGLTAGGVHAASSQH